MTYRPPIERWPAHDRALWRKGVETGGLFDAVGVGAAWSDANRRKTGSGYTAWLSWLAGNALLDPGMTPADRVTREGVAAWVTELQGQRAPYTVLARVRELYDALRVMAPEGDWEWLRQCYRSLKERVHPVRDKLSRLRSTDELVALGEQLMDEAEAAPNWSVRRRAVGYRDGFLIALLVYRPVRHKNLATMRLGSNLIKVGRLWHIVFTADETKTHIPYEAVLPSALTPRLNRYLDVHRPVLLRRRQARGRANSKLHALWVSDRGNELGYGPIGKRIDVQTRLAFGRSVNPHLFRDAAATSIAIDNPKHIGDASLVLGHAGHRTTEKHYNHARSLEASRRHAATLAHIRETLKSDGNSSGNPPCALLSTPVIRRTSRDASIDDQIRLCKEKIVREGWTLFRYIATQR